MMNNLDDYKNIPSESLHSCEINGGIDIKFYVYLLESLLVITI